jgi:hypothetical protein
MNKFLPNQQVEVNDWSRQGWRKAVILHAKPFYNKAAHSEQMGYEVQFTTGTEHDKVTGITPSQGGWFAENCVRESL